MSKRIYVENLPKEVTRSQVKELFSKYGQVEEVTIEKDGGVYVEMSSGADEAVEGLNEYVYQRRSLGVRLHVTRQ